MCTRKTLRLRWCSVIDNKIAVTDVDQWRYWLSHDFVSFEEYLDRLQRKSPMHPRARVGIDFHKALEEFAKTGNSYTLNADYDWDCDVKLQRPSVAELWVDKTYELPTGRTVQVRGKVDAIDGLVAIDYKTASKIDFESYQDNMQWRLYLSMLPEMEAFRYDVFQLSGRQRKRKWVVRDFRSFETSRYADMEDEIVDSLVGYDSFLQTLAAMGHIELTADGVRKEKFKQ